MSPILTYDAAMQRVGDLRREGENERRLRLPPRARRRSSQQRDARAA